MSFDVKFMFDLLLFNQQELLHYIQRFYTHKNYRSWINLFYFMFKNCTFCCKLKITSNTLISYIAKVQNDMSVSIPLQFFETFGIDSLIFIMIIRSQKYFLLYNIVFI
jgi:hypothetical protein